jgi:AraC-like DNA-binding protein
VREVPIIEQLLSQVESARDKEERERLLRDYVAKFQDNFDKENYREADILFCAITLAVGLVALLPLKRELRSIVKRYCSSYKDWESMSCAYDKLDRAYIAALLEWKTYISGGIENYLKVTVRTKLATKCLKCAKRKGKSNLVNKLRKMGIKEANFSEDDYLWDYFNFFRDDRNRLLNSFQQMYSIRERVEDYRILKKNLRKNLDAYGRKIMEAFLFEDWSVKKISDFYGLEPKDVKKIFKEGGSKLKKSSELIEIVQRLKAWKALRQNPRRKTLRIDVIKFPDWWELIKG